MVATVFTLFLLVIIIFVASLLNNASDWEIFSDHISVIFLRGRYEFIYQNKLYPILNCITDIDFFLKTALITPIHRYHLCLKNSMLMPLIWHFYVRIFIVYIYSMWKYVNALRVQFGSVQFSCQSCPTLCNPMNSSMPGLPGRRRQRHPTPVLLLGKSHGRRSLLGCNPWGR